MQHLSANSIFGPDKRHESASPTIRTPISRPSNAHCVNGVSVYPQLILSIVCEPISTPTNDIDLRCLRCYDVLRAFPQRFSRRLHQFSSTSQYHFQSRSHCNSFRHRHSTHCSVSRRRNKVVFGLFFFLCHDISLSSIKRPFMRTQCSMPFLSVTFNWVQRSFFIEAAEIFGESGFSLTYDSET